MVDFSQEELNALLDTVSCIEENWQECDEREFFSLDTPYKTLLSAIGKLVKAGAKLQASE